MVNWQGFRYPAVARNDILHELYLTSLGRIIHPASSDYPLPGHPPEFQFNWKTGRRLGDFALVWIERGHGELETTSLGSMRWEPGTVLLLAPGEWHRYRPEPKSGWVERWVCANGAYLHRLRANGVFPSSCELCPIRNQEALNGAFDQLRGQSDRNCLWVAGLTLATIALALGETEQNSPSTSTEGASGDTLVDSTVHYIWTNCHRTLSVDDIARQMGASRRMLERRFAGAWPRTIAQELTLARVQRGRALLADKSLSVKEAGYATGFGGARRFISAHRRIFGTTPGSDRH